MHILEFVELQVEQLLEQRIHILFIKAEPGKHDKHYELLLGLQL